MALAFADTYDELAYTYGQDILNILPPWMLQEPTFAQAFLEEVIEAGGTSNTNAALIAMEVIRQAPEYRQMYDDVFTGNRREDGTLRLTESAYFSRIQGYRDALATVSDVDPAIFEEEYGDLISGDVGIDEFQLRVDALYTRILENSPFIRDYYAENFGIDMTDAGILASMMSSRVGDAVLLKQITMAEIGGEASMRNYDLTTEFVNMLENQGMKRADAQEFFGSADSILPVLGALAQRHGDSDDTFDLFELAQANVFLDAGQMKRITQLVSQEEAMFTGGAQVELTRSQAGGLEGLEAI